MSWTRTYVGLCLLWLLTFGVLLALCSLSARHAYCMFHLTNI